MSLVPFDELMVAAGEGGYAIGYFESWDLASLMAVADAAEATRSPVILGFSGIYLRHRDRLVGERLSAYAALGLDICHTLSVPAALVYNESPDLASVFEAAGLGFSLVMYSDEGLEPAVQQARVGQVVEVAHRHGAKVEGEIAPLPGVGGELAGVPDDARLTDADAAVAFVAKTGVDALAVNLGQMHLHGRRALRLDMARLHKLEHQVPVPLVLHGASSVRHDDLRTAIELGIRKINVGSLLKQAYFEALRAACAAVEDPYNPYEVVGSGLKADVLTAGRIALQQTVEELMRLFGSVDKA